MTSSWMWQIKNHVHDLRFTIFCLCLVPFEFTHISQGYFPGIGASHMVVPVSVKLPWRLWVNNSHFDSHLKLTVTSVTKDSQLDSLLRSLSTPPIIYRALLALRTILVWLMGAGSLSIVVNVLTPVVHFTAEVNSLIWTAMRFQWRFN